MSAGNSASKSSTRTIPPAFSRNTISSPRRKISTSELLTRNCFGSLTAWLFPDLNTRAMAMICLPDIYTAMYIHLQAPIPELWAEQRTKRDAKGHENLPFCALDGFNEIRATLLEGMAGTTRLELATSAVTGSVDWFYNNLQGRGDCQTTRKSYKTTRIAGWIVG